MNKKHFSRRDFLNKLSLGVISTPFISPLLQTQKKTTCPENSELKQNLTVWSCGGLGEGLIQAHNRFSQHYHCQISYTGAAASALGKSLIAGTHQTDIFSGRSLELAKKLKNAGRLKSFHPLCFSQYVILISQGNPKNIQSIEDLLRPEVRVAMTEFASPPGGLAVSAIYKKAGIYDQIKAKIIVNEDCAQRTAELIATQKADAMIVEKRVSRLTRYINKVDIVTIPETLMPPGPLAFTTGMMNNCQNIKLSQFYLDWILSYEGQKFLENAGFIPANSPEGKRLIEKLGVKDV